jgi:hypothetical protein
VVFSTSTTYAAARSSVAQAWFAIVLSDRFQAAQASAVSAHRLKAAVERANADALTTWSEMLAFVQREDIYDTARIDECVADWAQRMGTACLQVEVSCRAFR